MRDFLTEIKNHKFVICDLNEAESIGYMNVFEEGDIWIKIKGCESCSIARRVQCCGNCKLLLKDTGECRFHNMGNLQKTMYCVVTPMIDDMMSGCQLEFKCIKGSKLGKIRKVGDTTGAFHDS